MFGLFESSRSLGQPLELFLFQVGADVYAYCNGDKDYVYGGYTYTAVPIEHSAITASGSLDNQTLTVSIANTVPLASKLRGYPASVVVTLTIRQGHQNDPDAQFLVAWAGRVLGAQGNPEEGTRELTCEPVSTSLRRIGLRRNWQYPCPHVLFGDQCRASQAAASVTATPSAISGRMVTLPSGWNGSKPLAKFAGGLFLWGSEARTIIRTSPTVVTLGGPATFALGTQVTLTLGCDHLRDDCMNLHVPVDEAGYGGGNIHNYGGQPYIPQTNPIGYVSQYS